MRTHVRRVLPKNKRLYQKFTKKIEISMSIGDCWRLLKFEETSVNDGLRR